jgi:hypothetical protein
VSVWRVYSQAGTRRLLDYSLERGVVGGRVLEDTDSTYTERVGSGVTHKDVMDIDPINSLASCVGLEIRGSLRALTPVDDPVGVRAGRRGLVDSRH